MDYDKLLDQYSNKRGKYCEMSRAAPEWMIKENDVRIKVIPSPG
jgi:hypothetical protein